MKSAAHGAAEECWRMAGCEKLGLDTGGSDVCNAERSYVDEPGANAGDVCDVASEKNRLASWLPPGAGEYCERNV